MVRAGHNRARRITDPHPRKSIARLAKALETELAILDADIGTTVRGSPLRRATEDLLASVPGVGPVIARTPIAELPELGALDRRRVASLVGLAPHTRRSGRWKGHSRIGAGRSAVRAALSMGAMAAKRFNPVRKAFHERLLAKGKPKMLATIAVARKLLTILDAMMRDRHPWQSA
jgi:transposase